jgi:preprotein translocase subunit SecB
MDLKPISHKVVSFEFHPFNEENGKDEFELDFNAVFLKDNKFKVKFYLTLYNNKDGYYIKADYDTIFETSEQITEDFKESNFPNINAPAIAFPFLRSFISFITLTAGHNSILLPSINFIDLYKKKHK